MTFKLLRRFRLHCRYLFAVFCVTLLIVSVIGFLRPASYGSLLYSSSLKDSDDDLEEVQPEAKQEDEGRDQIRMDLIRRFESNRKKKGDKNTAEKEDDQKAAGNPKETATLGFKRFDRPVAENEINGEKTKPKQERLVVKDADGVVAVTSHTLVKSLQNVADTNRRVIISVVDFAYINFAINFKRYSIDRLNITNFLLVCVGKKATERLQQLGLSCETFDEYTVARPIRFNNTNNFPAKSDTVKDKSDLPSDFGTADYYRKTNIKTAVILQALTLGYSVLMVDPDVVLFKNPFQYFNCSDCDVFYQLDRQMYNTGFSYIKPTTPGRNLYKSAWNLYVKYQRGHDQTYINMAIKIMLERKDRLKIYPLSTRAFPCGVYYFEHEHRMFENKPQCEHCVMAHNNYLGSVAAKIYRFKENLLWNVDDNGYYSNETSKYLTYDNPVDSFNDTSTSLAEIQALKTALALATLTNRTLILPRFHCCPCSGNGKCSHPRFRCSLLSVLRLRTFDEQFRKIYRENSFLKNPLVPQSIVDSQTKSLFLATKDSVKYYQTSSDVIVVNIGSLAINDTLRIMKKYKDVSVIRFHSLYNVIRPEELQKDSRLGVLNIKFSLGIVCSNYEQWEKSGLEFVNPVR